MNQKLLVPDIGDFEKVEVIEILVKVGDNIKINNPIVTIESDKSSVEVPSTSEGKVHSINVKIGDKVSKGDLLVTLVDIKNLEQKPKINKEEKLPFDTEKIIKEAEKTLVLEKEVVGKETKVKKDMGPIEVDVKSNMIMDTKSDESSVKLDEKIKGKVKTQKDKLKKLRG